MKKLPSVQKMSYVIMQKGKAELRTICDTTQT